jgi:lipopolysaccharide biosynthesis glycosyltransferase
MKVGFVTTLDDRYMSGFFITLNSILKNSKNFNHDIVIFEWGNLSEENKKIIQNFYNKIIFKKIETDLYDNYLFDDTYRKWTYNCNYRFDIFTLDEYDRVVFFDCDMIFEVDMEELLSYDVDFGVSGKREAGKTPQIGNKPAFNAGFMSIGKKYLGKHIRQDLIDISRMDAPEEESIKTRKWISDEPIINTYFLDKATFLPKKYNLIISEIKNADFQTKNNYHFTGHNKPWYSKNLKQQFSPYSLEQIAKNNNPFLVKVITQKLINLVHIEVDELLKKDINIYNYVGEFYE